MIQTILFALWFFAPAGAANASPVFANKIPLLKKLGMPIDQGKSFRGKRIFGDHKTVRGFAAGILIGGLTGFLQYFVYKQSSWVQDFSSISYDSLTTCIVLGILLGFGALAGDAIKSFFKRQCGVASGKSWFPFDQIDYIIGGLLLSALVSPLTVSEYVAVVIVWFLIHPLATVVGWLTGLKDSPI